MKPKVFLVPKQDSQFVKKYFIISDNRESSQFDVVILEHSLS